MNNYPSWWDTTLTIYNKYKDPLTDVVKWHKTKIENAFWKYRGNKITIGDTILETTNAIARIRKDERYLPRYEWEKLTNTDMLEFFTLSIGDIIVVGDTDDEINEYVSGSRSSDIVQKHKNLQGCMIVEAVTDNTGNSRNNPHYYLTGI